MASTSDFSFAQSKDILDKQAPLLDAFDTLRQRRVDLAVDFPQWVVIGDQNTGKSSVMEAITGIPFPVQNDLCTRFPIQLELRHAANAQETKVQVTVLPNSSTNDQRANKLKKFKRSTLNTSQLPKLIEEAGKEMEILSKPTSDGSVESGQHQFSDDILRIHASGPELPSLSMIDLPGLYNSPSKDQNKDGIELVKNIALRYAKQKSSIVLLVITAGASYECHTAPGVIKDIEDVERRTLGVITSPDKAENPENLRKILNSEVSSLKIRWHCLRNLSQSERDKVPLPDKMNLDFVKNHRNPVEEKFFKEESWKDIPEAEKGIISLRKTLQDMLGTAISEEIPQVMEKLTALRDDAKKRLDLMGKPLLDAKQEHYLTNVALEFEDTAGGAVRGEYDGRAFFGRLHDTDSSYQAKRLRAQIREMNRVFACAMKLCGQTKVIRWETEAEHHAQKKARNTKERTDDVSDAEQVAHDSKCEDGQAADHTKERADLRLEESYLQKDVINTYLALGRSEAVSREEYESSIRQQYRQWDGRQHPQEANPAMISLIFYAQSQKWKQIAETHIEQVWGAAKTFVDLALRKCAPDGVQEKLKKHVIDENLEHLKMGMLEKLKEILEVHCRANPGIFDAYEILQERRADITTTQTRLVQEFEATVKDVLGLEQLSKVADILCQLMSSSGTRNEPKTSFTSRIKAIVGEPFQKMQERLTGIQKAFARSLSPDFENQPPASIVERSETFYKDSMMQFVGCVNGLVVEQYLMEKLPRGVFSRQIVQQRSKDESDFLNSIVGEDEDMARTRKEVEKDLKQLTECLEKLKR